MIGLHNYEIWFIDFLDGKLTDAQEGELRAFLAQHPDLQAELDEMLADMPLVDASVEARIPLSLHKKIVPVGEIGENSYENFFVAYHEGDLNENQKKQLHDFLSRNQFLVRDLNHISRTVVSHNNEVYPYKSRLKKSPVIISIFRYAAAASVVVLLGAGALRFMNAGQDPSAIMASRKIPALPLYQEAGYMAVQESTVQSPANFVAANTESKQVVGHIINSQIVSLEKVEMSSIERTFTVPKLSAVPPPQQIAVRDEPADRELSIVQVFGKVIEEGLGRTGLSEGLQSEEKITGGDVVDVVALAFKNVSDPLLVTSGKKGAGNRRVKFNLGIFEADFALR